ncbi:hypothetical protein ASE55_19385 [Chryseobacterium sp. Leaf201]|nr:hypothetical protein ASE55_19385 [Chryseobacterium sp. Leaf201]
MLEQMDGSYNNPYKFNAKELDEDTGLYYYGARYYNPRLSIWYGVDPLAENYSSWSPYAYTFDNPVIYTDPSGMAPEKELPDNQKLGKGDWHKSDREANTQVWKDANKYNLQQKNGSSEYTNIVQRTAFYKWFQTETESRGYETKWAGAAYIIANQMAGTEDPWLNWAMSSEIKQFAQDGNKEIFDNVFPKLRGLYNGGIRKGEAAKSWDIATLTVEQRDIVGPIYKRQSSETLSTLSQMAKGESIYGFGVPLNLIFNPKGDITNWKDRFNHGMQKAVPAWEKSKGGSMPINQIQRYNP